MAITQRIVFGLALACMVSALSGPTLALDPALDVSQYAHTAWKVRDGFTKGRISSFAQTQDGYLWLGTDSGLLRFDGVRNVPWQPPAGTSLPDNRIRTLFASRDGTLWIGTARGLASWNGSSLRNYAALDGKLVNGIVQDREGTVWVGAQSISNIGSLCALRSTAVECFGEDGRFGIAVLSVYEGRRGALWATSPSGLWRWKPGQPKLYPLNDSLGNAGGAEALSETAAGEILMITTAGVRQLTGDTFKPLIPGTLQNRPNVVLRDRDGGVWMGTTAQGLLHMHEGRRDAFTRADGLSGDTVSKIFEDREGNVWVATLDGIDRFRALPATTYSVSQGLSGVPSSVLADRDGSIWLDTTAGLHRWRDGRLLAYRARSEPSSRNAFPTSPQAPIGGEVVVPGLPEGGAISLFQDRRGRIWLGSMAGLGTFENDRFTAVNGLASGFIDSIAEDNEGNVWVAHRNAGLLRVSPDLTVQPVRKPLDEWRLAADPVQGGLWLGHVSGGIVHFADGRARVTYSADDGLGKGTVNDVRVAADGTVWAATDGGLSRIKDGRVATLNSKSGLPCDAAVSSIEDDQGATWVYMACGLVRVARSHLDAWAAAADRGSAPQTIPTFVLDDSDGVRYGGPVGTASPHLTKTRDGKLWFITSDGVSVVDPRHLPINALPPPVHVEQIVADHQAYAPSGNLTLPPLVRDLQLDYTALSLVAPEKMQFRYKLEGRDRDWEDAGNRRQAFYTDLAPGQYRFRVIASNNSGVWNEEGATLAFAIAPAYWQTNWFLALCAAAFAALIWGAFRLRTRQLAGAQEMDKRHRQMEIELAHSNRLATMGQLTASIAHEVNQPLGATITNSQAALRWLAAPSPDLDEVRQALEQTVRAGNRAADVVANVRRLAKKAPAPEQDIAVNNEIAEIVAITRGEATKHGVWMRCDLAPDLPIIKADRVELQQVMLNLIVNAIQAMSTLSEGPRELLIRTEADGGGVIVSVSDTGPGLDAAAMERIFQPFYTSKESGLGMGLSICRSIIESHGGKLWASANTPRGAIFQFTLPPTRPQ